jgi:hypothetical protein
MARLLPCPYFLVTFTLPAALRAVARANQRVCYAALFEASSEALKTLAADPKYLGAKSPGFVGVLHTWGRTLEYHPHVHYLVPGGGVSEDGATWLPSRPNFFVPVKALSVIYRAKFREAMRRAGLLEQIDPSVWHEAWVVHSQAVGDGRDSLKYLAPYVFRVAISDRRILSCDDGKVAFSYRKSGSQRWRTMELEAMERAPTRSVGRRRFLQHVLPSGFQKVRHYGFLSPNANRSIESVRWLVTLFYGLVFVLLSHVSHVAPAPPRVRCPHCGGAMIATGFTRARAPPYVDTS